MSAHQIQISNGRTGGWMNGWMARWMNGWMGWWTDRWVIRGWRDGWMDGLQLQAKLTGLRTDVMRTDAYLNGQNWNEYVGG